MKIAVFSDNFYPELSGISDSIATTATELGKRGHTVKFFVPKYSKKNFRIANFPLREIHLGGNVHIHRIRSLPFPGPTRQSRAVSPVGVTTLAVKKFNPDIIHTHLFFGVGIKALTAAKVLGIPLVGTSHTPITEFVRYSPIRSKWFMSLSARYVSWYYNRCDFVSAPSQAIFKEMNMTGFRKPCQVISNPIDISAFTPVSDERRKKLKEHFQLSDRVALYTGRLAPEKNIDVIIRAITLVKKTVPEVNFAVTGHGSARESLEKLVKELHLEKQVKFLGTLHRKEFIKIYQAADIFAIASTAETQSISLMQAMAVGLPVVGVRWLALGEYITEKNGFLVKVGDHKTLAKKIIFLLRHPEKRKALGRGGIKTVKNFSIPKVADQWEEVYKKVISMKKNS